MVTTQVDRLKAEGFEGATMRKHTKLQVIMSDSLQSLAFSLNT